MLEARAFLHSVIGSNDKGLGYVQGMSYLVAVLLLHTPSEHAAFAYLAAILELPFVRCFYT